MKTPRTPLYGLTVALLASAALLPQAHAITIAHGGDSVDIDFVDIGNAGNVGQTYTDNWDNTVTHGAVSYDYQIGTFEVTAQQWAAVSSFDANVETGTEPDPWSGSQPTANVNWNEAAKFANWLTSGDALQGAYQFSDPSTFIGIDRITALSTYGKVYVLPTEDEWYKAAYFKSDGSGYTTWSKGNSRPVAGLDANFHGGTFDPTTPWNVGSGTMENNGTYDMFGNVSEYNESKFGLTDAWVRRGLSWYVWDSETPDPTQSSYRSSLLPGFEFESVGFRVAAIDIVDIGAMPEPSSVGLLAIGAMGCMLRRKR